MRTVVPFDDSELYSFDEGDEILTRYVERDSTKPQEKIPIISLTNRRYVYWCICTAILSIWSVFSSPFIATFIIEVSSLEAVMAISIIVDLFFMFDIVLNFRTSFINRHTGDEISDPRAIAHNYLISGKLIIDLLSAFPYDYVTRSLGSSEVIWKSLSFLRILRAYRLSKLVVFLRARDEVKLMIKFLQLFMYLIMYVHVIGCIFFLIVSDNQEWIPPCDTIKPESEFYTGGLWRRYWFSFYHSVFLLVGVEIFARTNYEYLFTVSCYICGAIINALVVGEMAVISTSLNRKATRFAEIADNANTTMKNMKLPEDLQLRIFDYLIATQNILEYKDELESFEQIIPPSLQQEVRVRIYCTIVDNNSFFRENPALSQGMTKVFRTRFCQPDEALVMAGEDSDFMYFIATGKCEVEVFDEFKQNHLTRYLRPGDYFGEVGLIYKTKRTATVRISVYSNLAVMSATDFYSILHQFPDLSVHLKSRIHEYKDHWRCFLLNALNMVPYLRNLSLELQDQLIYSLEAQSYDTNATVLAENSNPKDVIIVVEGSLSFNMSIKTSFDLIRLQNEDLIDEESLTTKKTGWMKVINDAQMTKLNTRSRLSSNLKVSNDTEVSLAKVGIGSIINANVALSDSFQACSLKTLEPTTLLILNIPKLERLAKNNLQLRNQMEKAKNSLSVYDTACMTYIKKAPNIDVIYNFPITDSLYRRKQWRLRLKFKNSIVRVICRNREIKMSGIPNVRNLCLKLRAVITAEERGLHKLAKEIARGEVDPDVIGSVDLLNLDEITRPLLKKFALVAKQSKLMIEFLDEKFNSISNMLSRQHEKVEMCSDEVKDFNGIVDSIEKLSATRRFR